jgi:hypothetical protein
MNEPKQIPAADVRWLAGHLHDPELAAILYAAVVRSPTRPDLHLVPCRVWRDWHRGTIPAFTIISDGRS